MKYRMPNRQESRALTRIELLVILVVVFLLGAAVLSSLSAARAMARGINCASNLKQVNIAFRIWGDDHGNVYPQSLADSTNSQALPSIKWPATGTPDAPADSRYTYLAFAVMSNELNTPKVLICPTDNRVARTNFANDFIGAIGGHNLGVSYFAGRDAREANPQMFLTGDRNLCADTTITPIPNHGYGLSPEGSDRGAACVFTTNYQRFQFVGWAPATMHKGTGNVGLADGSVQEFSASGLVQSLVPAHDPSTNSIPQNYLLFP